MGERGGHRGGGEGHRAVSSDLWCIWCLTMYRLPTTDGKNYFCLARAWILLLIMGRAKLMPDPQKKHCEGKELQNLHPIPIQSHFYFLGWIVVRTESQSSGILCSAGRDTETYCLLIENRKLIQTNVNAFKENRKQMQMCSSFDNYEAGVE